MFATLDYMVESGEIIEIKQEDIAIQNKVYISGNIKLCY